MSTLVECQVFRHHLLHEWGHGRETQRTYLTNLQLALVFQTSKQTALRHAVCISAPAAGIRHSAATGPVRSSMQRQVQVQQTTGLHVEPHCDEFEGEGS